ncbi:hypothetical protein PIB30_089206 [Stylosanthes scabra]|uniref:Uncharacterized protein n=1 Tax=Stylosanthes scabra TaxID=79078 RepID=A0ABU6VSC8_9FABA|nr:hypothetical protein [Stylosanthes scabra]
MSENTQAKDSSGKTRSSNNVATTRVSFRDKLVGDFTAKALGYADSLTGEKMALIDSNTDDDITNVSFILEARNALCDPYNEVVVVKLLGKHIGYTSLIHKLRGVWRIKETMKKQRSEDNLKKEEELKNQANFKDGYRYPATWYRYLRDRTHKLKGMSRLVNQATLEVTFELGAFQVSNVT